MVGLDLTDGKVLRVHPTQQPSLLVEVVGDCTLQGPSLQATRVLCPLITHLFTLQVVLRLHTAAHRLLWPSL